MDNSWAIIYSIINLLEKILWPINVQNVENQYRGELAQALNWGWYGWALLYAAFNCLKCGKIAKKEFPEEDRKKMLMGTLGLVAGAIVLSVVFIWVLILLD